MKSLIKKPQSAVKGPREKEPVATPREIEVAQCCAKVSKAVAGCHD